MTDRSTIHTPTQRQLRALQRAAHLLVGAVLIVYVYAPTALGVGLVSAVRWLVVPTLVVSGVLLWKWPRIRTLMRRRRG